MSEQLHDEITSINAIYTEETLLQIQAESNDYSLLLPGDQHISLRLCFPARYPDEKPLILGTQSLGETLHKGSGQLIVDIARTVLDEVFISGSPCIFDLVEELSARLESVLPDAAETSAEASQNVQIGGQDHSSLKTTDAADYDRSQASNFGEPDWVASETVTEKKSVFIARLTSIESVEEAKDALRHLITTDKRVAKAAHNITAWRIRGKGDSVFQDCDDDGETAAGGRLLHLLQLMDVWNVMVVVTRWYGGVHLGPDRFRIINSVARDAVVKARLGKDSGKADTKKGGKR